MMLRLRVFLPVNVFLTPGIPYTGEGSWVSENLTHINR